jgi:ribonuclease T2
MRFLKLFSIAALLLFAASPAPAQQKGQPGHFNFYLLNIVPSTQFCTVQGAGTNCHTRPGFLLHGLWPQNDNGTYPVFCAGRPSPKPPQRNLDITPDITLLQHEWAKHGTCTTLAPDAFFAAEHRAFHAFVIPPSIADTTQTITLTPNAILDAFHQANPTYPQGSIILWCSRHTLTSVSACLSKDLKPIACQGLKSCTDTTIDIAPVHAPLH